MKTWKIEYISYAGNIRETFVDTDDSCDSSDATLKAYDAECSLYSSDNIHKVISVDDVS